MIYSINNNKYVIDRDDYKVFDYDLVKDLMTDYFNDYDYVLGDITYNKLRLKGFCNSSNKKCNKINNISILDDYVNDYCAYNCKWFLLKKIEK